MGQNPQYTVLRIKRKANEPPLSSLVIEDQGRARKRRDVKQRGVFKLADTVPGTWAGEGHEADKLRERIQGLMQTPAAGPALGAVPSPAPLEALSKTSSTAGSKRGRADDDDESAGPAPRPQPPHRGSSNSRQYRVVPRAPAFDPNLPPRVITNAEIEAAKSALQFIDAQAVAEEGQDKEMSAFQDMLNEYLKLEGSSEIKQVNNDDDEYVYDLYYRDVSGGTAEGANIGALLGYEDLSPPSTPPDSEPEDEADEDSNDEDFYRNDYPEDEDADEDMVGFDDAYSDGEWSKEDEEEERDVWDYR